MPMNMLDNMGKDSDALAGILLGILGIAVIAKIFSKKCKVCGTSVSPGTRNCPNCGSVV